MSYGYFSLDPVGAPRINPVLPIAASLRVDARREGGAAPGGAVETAPREEPATVDLPPLSPTSLRAQAVTGLLEARRADLVGADRALADPGAAARRSLADVFPEQDRDRPDAKAAQDVTLTRSDDGDADRRRAEKARREATIRADLISGAALAESARLADDQARAQAERAQESRRDAAAAQAAAQAGGVGRAAGADSTGPIDRQPADDPSATPESEPMAAGTGRDPMAALGDIARAADDVRRLRNAINGYAGTVRDGIERSVAEVNDLARRVADLNNRISDAVDAGRPVPADLTRQREQLVVGLARLTGATVQPGARSAVDVLVDGRTLVNGGQAWPLVTATGIDGSERVGFADGRPVSLSSGVLASRLGTYNGMLSGLAQAATSVLGLLASQATDPAGGPVPGGPEAAAQLGGLLRDAAHAVASSAAYAQVAAGVENLVSRLTHGDLPLGVRGSDMLIGAIEAPADAAPAASAVADTVSPMRAALGALGAVAAEALSPGGSAPAASVVSGAPGIATPILAPSAPAGTATVRVLSVASGGVVTTAQSFHPDSPLGDGRETTIGIVEQLGTPQERTTVVDVGRYPTPADLVSYINQSGADVRATLNELLGGTVQLHLEALSTGRDQNITIMNGSQPPAASAVLGRAVTLAAARDTMIEIQRAGRTAAVRQASSRTVHDILPGVALEVHRAEPARSFQVGVRRESGHVVDVAARLVDRASAAAGAARAAGAGGTAEAVLGALGLVAPGAAGARFAGSGAGSAVAVGGAGAVGGGTSSAVAESGGGATPQRNALPGVHLDRRGQPTLDRRELTAAFEADPEGTAGRLTVAARGLSSVAANLDGATWEAYAAARASQGPDPLGTYTPDTRRAGRDDAAAADLTRRERALLTVLGKLQDQGDWLGRQLGAPRA